jgi:hypothetical protein
VHGASVSGGGDADGAFGLLGDGGGGMAFDGDGLVGAALQREVVDGSCGVDAGQGADALEDAVEELRFLGGVGELLLVDRDRRRNGSARTCS